MAPFVRTVELRPDALSVAGDAILAAWREALVVVIRGSEQVRDVRAVYDALLPKVGTPHYLAEDVRIGDRESQRTGALWFEVRYDPAFPDAYRHSLNAQPLHTDGSYIPSFPNATLMCCVANANAGGETTFIAGDDLVACLREEAPDLLAQLETTPVPHARSGDQRIAPILDHTAQGLRLNWNYYCVAKDIPPALLELKERFFRFLQESPAVARATVAVKLAPGDAVVWKDMEVLHGRNGFSATTPSERFLWKCAVDVGVFP